MYQNEHWSLDKVYIKHLTDEFLLIYTNTHYTSNSLTEVKS